MAPYTENQPQRTEQRVGSRPRFLQNYLDEMSRRKPSFVPEYEYKSFFLSVYVPQENRSKGRTTNQIKMDKEYTERAKETVKEQVNIAKEILSHPGTTVTFYVRQEDLPVLLKFLNDSGLTSPAVRKRITISLNTSVDNQDILWAQDYGEPTGGPSSLYIKGWFPRSRGEGYDDRIEARRKFTLANSRVPFIQAPFVIEGGNLTKSISKDGTKYVIVGGSDLLNTRRKYKYEQKYNISYDELIQLYKVTFGADKVLVLGSEKNPPSEVFHIDQAVFFPKRGVAVLMKPELILAEALTPERAKVLEMLAKYKKQLKEAGFEVIEIPTTFSDISQFKACTNGNIITSGGKTYVKLPNFGTDNETLNRQQRIRQILAQHGIFATFLPNTTYRHSGNTHCITGAISYNLNDLILHTGTA